MSTENETGGLGEPESPGLEAIHHLSEQIGPRPPGSGAEAAAASYVAERLEELDAAPVIEEFASGRSFGPFYLATFTAGLAGGLLQLAGRGWWGRSIAGGAAVSAILESRYSRWSPAQLLRRRRSRNVIGVIEPEGPARRTVCLTSHLDSSRSGLMFRPRVTPHLGSLMAAVSVALIIQPLAGLAGRVKPLRILVRASQALLALGGGLVLERELFGKDVPGANDNASGVGACLALASRFSREPLQQTRVVILVTGSEESGPVGIRHFLATHDTKDWLFVNFDGVGADAPLRVLSREGGRFDAVEADPELLDLAARVGTLDGELAAPPLEYGSGLPYDATPVLAAGGKAISVVNQGEGAIPNYHWPTDRADRISRAAFTRAVRFGQKLVELVDGDS